jgi:hypothetical protein
VERRLSERDGSGGMVELGLGQVDQRRRCLGERTAEPVVAQSPHCRLARRLAGRRIEEPFSFLAPAQHAFRLEPGQHRADRGIADRVRQGVANLRGARLAAGMDDLGDLPLAAREPDDLHDGLRVAVSRAC